MKFSNLLLSAVLALKLVHAKVINFENTNIVIESSDKETVNLIENKDFKYEYHCVDDINGVCEKISNELSIALHDLSSTFEFKQPVVFDSYAVNTTAYGPQYQNLVAFTTDINFVSLKSSNDSTATPYVYTQALAKQLNTDREFNMKKNDFLILFNTDLIDLILTVSPDTSISTIILHEIIHGLGFIATGSLVNYDLFGSNTNYTTEEYFKDSSFLPSVLLKIDADDINNANTLEEIMGINGDYDTFVPLSIYQKYLIDLNTNEKIFDNIGFIHEAFNQCLENADDSSEIDINEVAKNCYENLDQETKDELSNIAQNNYINYQSTGFLTNDDDIMVVQTFEDEFISSSSISHNDSKQHFIITELFKVYGENIPSDLLNITEENAEELLDENFLMYYHAVFLSREFVLNTIAKNNKHGLIGPKIVSALKTMGWTEKGEQFSDDLYYVDNDDIPEQNSIRFLMKYNSLLKEALAQLPDEIETSVVDEPTETTNEELPTEISTDGLFESDDENDVDDVNIEDVEAIDSDEESN